VELVVVVDVPEAPAFSSLIEAIDPCVWIKFSRIQAGEEAEELGIGSWNQNARLMASGLAGIICAQVLRKGLVRHRLIGLIVNARVM